MFLRYQINFVTFMLIMEMRYSYMSAYILMRIEKKTQHHEDEIKRSGTGPAGQTIANCSYSYINIYIR